MSAKENLWAKRFEDVLAIDEIKRRADRPARPLLCLEKDTIEHACFRIESELREVFVTTSRTAEILQMNRHESPRHSRAVQNAFAQTLLAKACH